MAAGEEDGVRRPATVAVVDREDVAALLDAVATGQLSPDSALERRAAGPLAGGPLGDGFADLG